MLPNSSSILRLNDGGMYLVVVEYKLSFLHSFQSPQVTETVMHFLLRKKS